jgi:hypothetical protein
VLDLRTGTGSCTGKRFVHGRGDLCAAARRGRFLVFVEIDCRRVDRWRSSGRGGGRYGFGVGDLDDLVVEQVVLFDHDVDGRCVVDRRRRVHCRRRRNRGRRR